MVIFFPSPPLPPSSPITSVNAAASHMAKRSQLGGSLSLPVSGEHTGVFTFCLRVWGVMGEGVLEVPGSLQFPDQLGPHLLAQLRAGRRRLSREALSDQARH